MPLLDLWSIQKLLMYLAWVPLMQRVLGIYLYRAMISDSYFLTQALHNEILG